MKIFLIVLVVMLIIAFRKEIGSFFSGMNSEVEVKKDENGRIISGNYVITQVNATEVYCKNNGFSCIKVVAFSNGRVITKKLPNDRYTKNLWDYVGRNSVFSHVQKFSNKGVLLSEKFLPVPLENVCFKRSGKPYYKR
mgnify:CR=1 FL=1